MSEPTQRCEHCSDGHRYPHRRPWSVWVSESRDGDGQPVRISVSRSDGAHVSESDAQWLRDLIRAAQKGDAQ